MNYLVLIITSIYIFDISRVFGMNLFRGIFRSHPTTNMCAVAQYRKRFPSYYPETNSIISFNTLNTTINDDDVSVVDENNEPMEHGEVAWNIERHTNLTNIYRHIPRIPVIYLWTPSLTYRLFGNRSSTKLREFEKQIQLSFVPYTGTQYYEDSETLYSNSYWDEPLQIVFLFV